MVGPLCGVVDEWAEGVFLGLWVGGLGAGGVFGGGDLGERDCFFGFDAFEDGGGGVAFERGGCVGVGGLGGGFVGELL